MNHPQRLNALDNLRAIMMWLGIVVHVSVIYLATKSGFPYHDRQSTPIADLLLLGVHTFRMPVFFILAGFFVAMLANKKGYDGMIKHRLRRIALPFILFWPLIFAISVVSIMAFVHVMVHGSIGIDPKLIPIDPNRDKLNTMHLWFLYYLFWFSVVAALLGYAGKGLPEKIKSKADETWTRLGSAWWGFLVLAVPLCVTGFFHPAGVLPASGSFILRPDEFIHNGLFFAFGWYFYGGQDRLLSQYSKYCWSYALAGSAFFVLYVLVLGTFRNQLEAMPLPAKIWLPFAYGSTSWLFSFALIGMFTRYLPARNTVLEYISQSSYWVYLVHFPFTIAFGAVLYKLDAGAPVKMALNIAATTAACLLTYHVLVRRSPIGVLLNGRRLGGTAAASVSQGTSAARPG